MNSLLPMSSLKAAAMTHDLKSSSQRQCTSSTSLLPMCMILGMVGGEGMAGFVELVWVEPVKTMDAGRNFQPRRDLWRWLLFPSQNLGDKSLRNTSAGGNFYLGHVHERRI